MAHNLSDFTLIYFDGRDETGGVATGNTTDAFEEAYGAWNERYLTQEEAAQLLGVFNRTFRHYIGPLLRRKG